jgi:beta-glucuronidase
MIVAPSRLGGESGSGVGRRVVPHLRRRVTSLDGLWDFAFVGEVDPDDVVAHELQFDDAMAVPGCWDATPAYAGRRGLAAYRTCAYVSDVTPHELVFDALQHWGRVFVDGVQVAEHAGGFTRFRARVPAGQSRTIEVVVLVDNRDDARRSPLHRDFYDWYHYGGLSGSVSLHRLGEHWISGVRCTTVSISPDPVVEIAVETGAIHDCRVSFVLAIDGIRLIDELVHLEPKSVLVRRLALPGLALWSLDDPELHLLEVALGSDDQRQRIGLRTVAVDGRSLTVNGAAVRLFGVNRHDSHPDHGFALSDDHRLADLQLISDLGANFVRGSHYPQDEGFLDLCDERGIAVWCEATSWQPDARQLTDAAWLSASERNIDEMVAMASGHPSVLIWGCCNEGDSKDLACRPGFARLLGRLRAQDPGRPVTYATMLPFESEELAADLADIVAVNTYPGWYFGRVDSVAGEIDRIEQAVAEAGLDDRPLIVSEIGAEAIRGWHDAAGGMWSEAYQARLIEAVIDTTTDSGRAITGVALWLFADFRVSDLNPRIMRRPRAHNNKGLFDEYRCPKLSASAVRAAIAPSGGRGALIEEDRWPA